MDLGELTMYVARAAADGTMPKNGTFHADGLGNLQVKDGMVLFGSQPTIFDKATTDEHNF